MIHLILLVMYKMKIKFFLVSYLTSFLFVACQHSSRYISSVTTVDTIDIIRSVPNIEKYSNIFKQIDYIRIPYDNTFCIGKVNKLLVTDSLLFVMDRKISRGVYCFDSTGNSISAIHKTGVAPGEYISMRNLFYGIDSEEILIYAAIRQKMLHFSLNGTFLYETDLPFNSLRVEPIGGNCIMYNDYRINEDLKWNGKYPNLILWNPKKNSVEFAADYFKAPAAKATLITSEPQFSKLNDTLYSIKPDHCNTVYHVTPHQIYPAYQLDFGPYNLDDEFWDMASQKRMKFKTLDAYSDSRNLCETFRFLEGEDFLYFVCKQKKTVTHVFYSKKTKTLKQIAKFENDMDYVTPFRPIAIYDDKLYGLLDSEEVYNMKEELKGILPDTILENVQEFGNPIIAIFTLKPF